VDLIDLLAKSNDDFAGLIGFCVFAGFIVFLILAKAISSVSPEAMARKIRELQGQPAAERAAVARPVPARYEEPVYAQLVAPPLATAPKKKKRKKKPANPDEYNVPRRLVADQRVRKAAPATAAKEGTLNFRQGVIMAELLAPPLSLRHGRGGLLRSAPWIR